MKSQSYKNHSRYVLGYHVFTFLAILALLGGSIANLVISSSENRYSASLIVLIAIIFVCFFWFTRAFAVKVQDRAIRAEESLRYFILTGKPLNKNLKINQIIALRFASDEEFEILVTKAVTENLTSNQIKQLIQNWRPDLDRA
jgi:glucan phosphoethanolaminetransferase (alkaline phosphatase superfamily)